MLAQSNFGTISGGKSKDFSIGRPVDWKEKSNKTETLA
jgi:hypothetical protein